LPPICRRDILPPMKLHPRVLIVQKAQRELSESLWAIEARHRLTFAEMFSILAQAVEQVAKYAIRAERHPEDPSRPGGLE